MKYKNLLATTAMAVVLAAGAAAAADLASTSFSAGVSLASPTQTGFLFTGTTTVTGLGSAAVAVSTAKSEFNTIGFANSSVAGSSQDGTTLGFGVNDESGAKSGVLTTFDFTREVTASAAGIGIGQVQALGEANAAVGAEGTAFGETKVSTIQEVYTTGATPTKVGDHSSTSSASSTSDGSLDGQGSTSVLAGLIGTTSGFVGDTGTTVSSTQSGISYGALSAVGDNDGTGIDIKDANLEIVDGTPPAQTFAGLSAGIAAMAPGEGAVGFKSAFTLGAGGIDLAVANVGGGTISLGATSGGFFGGKATGLGEGKYAAIWKPAP